MGMKDESALQIDFFPSLGYVSPGGAKKNLEKKNGTVVPHFIPLSVIFFVQPGEKMTDKKKKSTIMFYVSRFTFL
jgi:hypothetical protein